MVWVVLMMTAGATAMSLTLTAWLVRVGWRLGQMDTPGTEPHKTHTHPVPSTGGIAIFWTTTLPIVAALALAWSSWGQLLPTGAQVHLPGVRQQTGMAAGVLGAMTLMHVVGLIDDRRRLGPGSKLAAQFLTAAALVLFCDMRTLTLLGDPASVVVSILWIVVIVNAMNMLDNMDGLSGGVGAIISGIYLAAALVNGQWFVAALAALLLGALLGFLVFNFPRARLFMGDGGSLVLGLLLAVVSVRTTYYGAQSGSQWFGVLMPVLVMAVPLYDFLSVTTLRLRQGRNPMAGDRNHFSHRLVRKGLSTTSAVVVIWLATLATGMGGVMLGRLEGWQATVVAAQCAAVLAMIAALERGK